MYKHIVRMCCMILCVLNCNILRNAKKVFLIYFESINTFLSRTILLSTIIKCKYTENINKILRFHLQSRNLSISHLSAWQPTTTTHTGIPSYIVRKSGNNNKIKKRMEHYECINHQFSQET